MARRSMAIFMMTAAVLLMAQAMAFAGGGGPEPGAGCSTDGRLKYIPPPFNGMVTLTYNSSVPSVSVTGFLTQVGNSECTISINSKNYYSPIEQEQWDAMKPVDLRQRCLEVDTDFTISDGCVDLEFVYFEPVGVGNLKDIDGATKTANIVGMGLQ